MNYRLSKSELSFFYFPFLLVMLLSSCQGQRQPWEESLLAGKAALERSEYANSENLLAKGIVEAKASAVADSKLSELYLLRGRALLYKGGQDSISEARKLGELALSAARKRYSSKSPELIPYLKDLYKIAYKQEDFISAREYSLESLEIEKSSYGADAPQLIETLNQIVAATCASDRCSDTRLELQELLRLRLYHLGANHPHVAVSEALIGELEEKAGHYQKALLHYEKALSIRKKSEPHLIESSTANITRVHQKMLEGI